MSWKWMNLRWKLYQKSQQSHANLARKKEMVLFRIIKIFLPLLRWTQNPRRKTKHAETSMVILFPRITHSWMIDVWKKSRLPVDPSTLGCGAQADNTVKLYHQSPLRKLSTITYRVENWSPFLPASKLRECLKKSHNIPCIFACLYKSNNFQVVTKTLVGRSNWKIPEDDSIPSDLDNK